ncbi:MAG: RHS repeat protein, partial [Parachlamydiales bacterium]|nr:RHS repeat protein [Parachlamydiales bacterium]
MMRFLATFICSLLTVPLFSYDEEAKEEIFLSTPEQVFTLSKEPSFLIEGIISPLSGSPCLRQVDFVVKGAQEIALSRTYISPYMPLQLAPKKRNTEDWEKYYLYHYIAHQYKGWQFYPHLKLQFIPSEKQVLITDPSGSTLCFSFIDKNMTRAVLAGDPYGLSNCSGERPSGADDPRNIRITYNAKIKQFTVCGVDQTVRFYRFNKWDSANTKLYLLEKEILPNGKILKYRYEGNYLSSVESLDPQERFVYASIRVEGNPWNEHCHFLSSSGQMADYDYQRRSIHVKIQEKIDHWPKNNRFKGEGDFLCPPILSGVSSPNFRKEQLNYSERFLLDSYEGKDQHFHIVHGIYGEGSKHYRTQQLSLPVGDKDNFVSVYDFSYHPPIAGKKEGTTTVKSNDGTITTYHFSKNLLISKIQYFGKDEKLRKEKIFLWDDKNWLKTVEIRDRNKNLFYKKSYEYDQFGNPTLEIFTGNLSGTGELESIRTKRIFSDDGKNLLLQEETENGKVTLFSYLKGTNLITSKLIKNKNDIILREFWTYDDCHNLIEKVLDDGKSKNSDDLTEVTERHKITYILRQSAPFLHMPEWIIETYYDSGMEKLLKKSRLTYDAQGNVVQEEIYDANESIVYTIDKTYNERGDLLSETNRFGQKAIYTYDAKGRRLTENSFSGRIHKTLFYDARGRLYKMFEEGDDGNRHTTSSKYDNHDRLVKKQDRFDNCTYYKYDPLIGKVSQTDFPQIAALDRGSKNVRTSSTYDPFGRELSFTDANGNKTTYSYNVYGSLSKIHHPNDGEEIFRYAKNGDLISYTDQDGLTIKYKNDVLGRILKKTYISKESRELAEEMFIYNGFHLLSETDKEGQKISYFYDGAGRKIREEFCGRVTGLAYDSLGRLAKIVNYNGDEVLVTHYRRDLEDRILEEKKTDLSGKILYKVEFSYDIDGNRNSIIRNINGKKAVESFTYDPFQRNVFYRDALGYETHTFYNENYINALGQKVLQLKTVDPNGVITLKTYDAFSRNIQIEKIDSNGSIVSSQEMNYDPDGNLILHKDHVYEGKRFLSAQTVRYYYTPHHQVKQMVRGYGTSDIRKTHYSYSLAGKMEKKILPDGVVLSYSYDPFGYVTGIRSSDGEISHVFTHNRLGHLLTFVNEKQNLFTERKVDSFGNVLCEVFPHGAEIHKTYDNLNRPLSLTIAEHGKISFIYDPMFLREVRRLSFQGNTLYKHTFEEYDLTGNLTRECLIGDLGTVDHSIDLRGQKTQITSPYFSQECKYNPIQNLIASTIDGKKACYGYDDASQIIREEIEKNNIYYVHDSLYNRKKKNKDLYEVTGLNELLSDGKAHYAYDLRGNQVLKETDKEKFSMVYDPLNQLIAVTSKKQRMEFIYDPLGRCLAKIISTKSKQGWKESDREYYLYDGENEIGSFKSSNTLESFRVLSTDRFPKTLSIELGDQIFVPITDVQGNIRRLVDIRSKAISARYDFSAFGEKQQF